MTDHVIIDCPTCAVRVNAAIHGANHDPDSDAAILFASCPACSRVLLGLTEVIRKMPGGWEYEPAERLWPAPTVVEMNPNIPEAIRREIRDAQKCMSHNVYSAAVVLCGRALDRFAKDKSTGTTLALRLEDLKAKQIIDDRLFEWATALRKERNLGAHAADEEVTKENAQDVLDFTVAIFEYVYNLSEKYAAYKARKTK